MSDRSFSKPIYAVAGPTASGKTALAVEIALAVGGEVANFDSVQIYKEIQAATAKPTIEEMRGVPHHLIDYVDPRINYTAADWARDAEKKLHEIETRGRTAVFVGGTGFYLRTLLNPLFDSPKTDEVLRARLRGIMAVKGAEYLHRILGKVDPVSAERLFPRDYVRVIRALEFFFQTGRRLSDHQPERPDRPEFAHRFTLIVLNPPRDVLYEKIDRRTEKHFDSGLVDEVEELLRLGLDPASNALGAHGYRRVCEYLCGERSLENAIEKTKQDVRNYAKRQLTWFRREPEAVWFDGFGDDPRLIAEVLETLTTCVPSS